MRAEQELEDEVCVFVLNSASATTMFVSCAENICYHLHMALAENFLRAPHTSFNYFK